MDYTPQSAGVLEPRSPRLLDQVSERIRLRHYSIRTEQAYVGWIRRFILANGRRHPGELGAKEVEAFLTRLATQGNVAAATQNQALSAWLFLYRVVLEIELPWMEEVVSAKRPRRLPVVLSQEEVARMLSVMPEGMPELMARLLYGTGMRLLEGLRLRIKDVDFARKEICVRSGKGDKDRRVPLPESLRGRLLRSASGRCGCMGRTGSPAVGGYICRMRWHGNTRMPTASRAGSTCFLPGGFLPIHAVVGQGAITLARRSCSGPSKPHASVPASPSRPPVIRCGIPAPRICRGPATISAPCRNCWVTRTWRPRRSTRMCWGVVPVACSVRWIDRRVPGCSRSDGAVRSVDARESHRRRVGRAPAV